MLNLTAGSIDKFREILESEGHDGCGVRLMLAPGGCCPSLVLEITEDPDEDDEILELDGVKIFLNGTASDWLKDATMDYEDGSFIIDGAPKSSCSHDCSHD